MLRDTGTCSDFAIAQNDGIDLFQVPKRIYGRAKEQQIFIDSYVQACHDEPVVTLVKGTFGIGKSFLVFQNYGIFGKQKSIFMHGEYEKYKRDTPYSGLAKAIRTYIQNILTFPEDQLNKIRDSLKQELGENASMLAELVPEFSLVTACEVIEQDMNVIDAKIRFHRAFLGFFRALIKPQSPVVIFLDDMQWVDQSTLDLIEYLLCNMELRGVYFIFSYRDNEVSDTHSFSNLLSKLQNHKYQLKHLKIDRLPIDAVNEWLVDTFKSPAPKTMELSKVTSQKTQGNPYFIIQFLKHLVANKLIYFDTSHRCWEWDVAKIQQEIVTDNVLDIVTERFNSYPENTQKLLCIAACFGSQFEVHKVAKVINLSAAETFQALHLAINDGYLIVSSDLETDVALEFKSELIINKLRFAHQRTQQAALKLYKDEQLINWNYRIGKILQLEDKEENLFSVAEQFNRAKQIVINNDEQKMLISLNRQVARKAKKNAAFYSQKSYLLACFDLFDKKTIWETDYDFALEFYTEYVESEHLNHNDDEVRLQFEAIINKIKKPIDKAPFYAWRMDELTLASGYIKAVHLGCELLAELGVKLPAVDPIVSDRSFSIRGLITKIRLGAKIAQVVWKIKKYSHEELYNLPEVQEDHAKAVLTMLTSLIQPAYFCSPTYFAFIISMTMQVIFKKGLTREVCYGMAALSYVYLKLKNYPMAIFFSDYGYNIAGERYRNLKMQAECAVPRSVIGVWAKSFKEVKEYLELGITQMQEVGSWLPFSWCTVMYHSLLLRTGTSLDTLLQKNMEYYELCVKKRAVESLYARTLRVFQMYIRYMQASPQSDEFSSLDMDEATYEKKYSEMPYGICALNIFRCAGYYFSGKIDKALEHGQKADNLIQSVELQSFVIDHYLYYILSLLENYESLGKKSTLKLARSKLVKLKSWVQGYPENFMPVLLLLEARFADVSNRPSLAGQLYKRTLNKLKGSQNHQMFALCAELYALYLLRNKQNEEYRSYMIQAHSAYTLWGAKRKTTILQNKYEFLAESSKNKDKAIVTNETLDFDSAIKSSFVLAREVRIEPLLKQLIAVIIENSGAQRCLIILNKDGQYVIRAGKDAKRTSILEDIKLQTDNKPQLPLSVFNFVIRSSKRVVIANAVSDKICKQDIYVTNSKVKSIFCTPIFSHGEVIGVIYLDNSAATDVFNPNRVDVIELLATQAAISLENTELYSSLETKVKERTEALSKANDDLKQTLADLRQAKDQVVESEKMASLGRLVSGVAHELNTPLGIGITIASKLEDRATLMESKLASGTINESALGNLFKDFYRESSMIYDNLKASAQLIQNFKQLSVTQTESGRGQQRAIYPYIQQMLTAVIPRAKEAGVQITLSGNEQVKRELNFDYISQILLNLIENSLFHGFSEYEIDNKMINIDVQEVNSKLVITYSDNGCGIPVMQIPKIFDPFFTTARGKGKTGIGLNIVYNLVAQGLNGTIECKSEKNHGVQFTITI